MSHGYAVTYTRNAEEKRNTATGGNATLDKTLQIPHADMSRDDVVKTRRYRNKRLGHAPSGDTGSMQQRPVRHTLNTFFDDIGSHRHRIPLI